MKKFKFLSLILAAVMFSCIFAGCTAAKSADVHAVQSKFSLDVAEYLVSENRVNSAIIKKENNRYSFVFKPIDNGALENRANLNQTGNMFYNLSNEKEYNELLTRGSKYFFTKFMSTAIDSFEYDGIEQEKLTELYYQVENVLEEIKQFGIEYRDLSSDYVEGNTNTLSTKVSLENLLKQYKNLIGAVLKMNLATLDVYDNSLLTYVDLSSTSEIPVLEIDRLVDAFELYVTEYLYQRYMVCGSELDMNFLSGELMTTLKNVVDKSRASRQNGGRQAATDKTTYIYLRTIEKSMTNTIELNRHSAQVLIEGLPEASASDYEYKKAIYDNFAGYEATLIGYLNQIDSLIDQTIA